MTVFITSTKNVINFSMLILPAFVDLLIYFMHIIYFTCTEPLHENYIIFFGTNIFIIQLILITH
jgi:hypothetical protein